MTKRLVILIIAALIIAFGFKLAWFYINNASQPNLEKKLNQIDQNPSHYLPPAQSSFSISPEQLEQLKQKFLSLYFSPWQDETSSNAKVLENTQKDIQHYLEKTNWQYTKQIFPKETINKLVENADLRGFPQINRPGIVVHVTEARIFPTLLPAYGDPKEAGEGYPFDNWINSYMYPGTPVRILQSSKDQLWYLIKTASYYGWAASEDIGFVSNDFIDQWKKFPFVVPLQDNIPLQNSDKETLSHLHKGMIYPTSGNQGDQVKILTAFLSTDGEAKIQTLFAPQNGVQSFPIAANPQNIAQKAATFINGQYGWGGLYELRDCSATTSDILANFALWLPRNSLQQSRMGETISLAGMNKKQKLKIFAEKAIPFFTVVHFPGHVALFIGMRDGQAYILQDAWGFHTSDLLGKEGRAVVGKTIITPLDFTKSFSNVIRLQLDSADTISILKPESYSDEQKIRENVWQ